MMIAEEGELGGHQAIECRTVAPIVGPRGDHRDIKAMLMRKRGCGRPSKQPRTASASSVEMISAGLSPLANTHGNSSRVISRLYQRERETSI